MTVYLDSSALVKRYVEEDGSSSLRELLAEAEVAASLVLTYVEVASALAKATRLGKLTEGEAQNAFKVFAADWCSAIVKIELKKHLIEQSARLLWRRILRAYDALQLAGAIWFQKELNQPVLFATFDQELKNAARAEGIQVWP